MALKGRPRKEEGLHTIAAITSRRAQTGESGEAIKRLRKAHDSEYALCASDFWYWVTHITTEDEDRGEVRVFPQYDYLKSFYKTIEDNQKTVVLKSRRLLASWIMVLRHLHQAMFAGIGGKDVFRGGLMSIGQTEAEYLIQRISRAYRRLPEWMKARNPLLKDNTMYLEFEKGGTIQAFPLKREGPQTFGFSEVGFDEMALQEAVRTVWTGLLPTLGAHGKLVAVSTPNGKGNLFHDIWVNKDDAFGGIERIKMHWTDNPEHDQTWFDKTTDGMDSQMVARMFELSFAAYYGQPVWNTFNRQMHVTESTEVIEGRPMYLGWDLGFHFPACTFWQRNTKDQWVGHKELQGYDVSFDKFCIQVKELANTFYKLSKTPTIHCLPPDAKARYRSLSGTGAGNDVGEIRNAFKRGNLIPQIRFGPHEVGTRSNEGPRLKETRKTFALRADREPGMYVSEEMELFIEGCQGGYCYPEKGGEEPMKNECGHLQDSYQAVVVAYNRMMQPDDGPKTLLRQRPKIGGRTGL